MASLEQRLTQNELYQKKGQFLTEAQESGVPLGNSEPTEYAKSAKKVVDKMFDPQTKEDKMLLSRIPRNILINMDVLEGIENGIDALYSGDVELWNNKDKTVTFYLNSDNQISPNGDNKDGLIKYRTVTQRGYAEAHFAKRFWHGISGGLLMMLPAVEGPGNRAEQGVTVVGSITNSERALIEAQNNSQMGFFRRQYHKLFK